MNGRLNGRPYNYNYQQPINHFKNTVAPIDLIKETLPYATKF